MRIEHEYNSTKGYAYAQIDSFLETLQKKYGDRISNPSKSWNSSRDKMSFSFGVYGFTLNGTIEILEGGRGS
jgi:hypothetical protein